jgi:predicted RNase H-like HicB family nuclease
MVNDRVGGARARHGRINPSQRFGSHSMKYKIVLKHSREGYSVSCPGLPGCWSQGDSEEEAIANIRSAIEEYLAAIAETLRNADVREIEVPA